MRWIKYILLAMTGLAVLFLLLVAIVMVTFDNDDYRRLAIRGVNYFTGYTMTIEGPFALRFLPEPSVSAEAVQLVSEAGNAAPPVTRIGKVRIRIAPWPLLRGALVVRELLVDDASMAVTIGEKGQPGAHRSAYRGKPLDITLPILESVRLHNIALDVIDYSAHRTIEVRLLQFDIDDVRDSGPLFVEGKGTLSGNEFQIEGQLGALPKIFNGAEPYPVTLAIHTAGLRVSVSGTVQDFLEGEGLALRLSGQADDLSNLFKLLKIEAPPLGELKLEALVTRDMAAPRVSALSVGLSGDTSLEFTARGAIDNAISAAGANIQFDGSCADPRVFRLAVARSPAPAQKHPTDGRIARVIRGACRGAAEACHRG